MGMMGRFKFLKIFSLLLMCVGSWFACVHSTASAPMFETAAADDAAFDVLLPQCRHSTH